MIMDEFRFMKHVLYVIGCYLELYACQNMYVTSVGYELPEE